MRRTFLIALILVACSDATPSHTRDVEVEALSESQRVAVQGLRNYCQACHGLGELKFLISRDDEEVWAHLFTENAPNAGAVWAKEIQEVLAWPGDVPPDFEDPIEPGRDWMPKGAKRLHLAGEEVDGYPLRRLILDELAAQERRRRLGGEEPSEEDPARDGID